MTILSLFSKTNQFFFAALWVVAAIGLFLVPIDAVVPIVWSPLVGEPIVYASGWIGVLIMPVFGLFITVVLVISVLLHSKKDFDSGHHVFHASVSGLFFMLLILECTFIYIGRGGDIYYPKVAAIMAGGLLMVVGNMLAKSQPNRLLGIALQRAVHDPDNWRITHRWSGRLTVLTGAVLIVLAFTVLEGPSLFIGVFTAFSVPMLAGLALSYFASLNQKSR